MPIDFFKQFISPPTLTTPRLILRKILPQDANDMFSYASRQDVTAYLLWSPHPDLAYTVKYLKYVQGEYKKGRFFDWAIILAETERMIGTVGFTELDRVNMTAEIGYVVNPDYHGMGIATEAVSAVIGYAFCELKIERVEARYMVGNTASLRVMEKCGMKKEGILRSLMEVKGIRRDIGICSILKNEYFANKKQSEF
ncbi:MAG: GNAT family N-acetyltransferase [Ruminococcaceae bacterium]|nr:GNAT family N-acetyltransferase [Oscillospiraceae bacterium]